MGKGTTVLWTLATLPVGLRDVYLALFSLILTKQIGIDLLGLLEFTGENDTFNKYVKQFSEKGLPSFGCHSYFLRM